MPDTHLPDHRLDASEDIGSNPDPRHPIGELIAERLSRRGLFATAIVAATAATLPADAQPRPNSPHTTGNTPGAGPSTFTFPELRHQIAERDAVAEGYEIQTVIRWGDPIVAEAPGYAAGRASAADQAKQFGYNNDFLDFRPLPLGSNTADHGLLVVNHEYTNPNLMFPGLGTLREARAKLTAEQAAAEIAAHGAAIVEVKREGGTWSYVKDSRYNRRITGDTPMRVSGPAAGHARMRTNADPTGTRVLGTLNNCAGGNTPWGTVLTAEENFNFYFGGANVETDPQAAAFKRYGIVKESVYPWGRFQDRFDLAKEPNEANRFGWVVEFDPYDPNSVPVKRTALGRFKHEGATHAINRDGRVVFYQGDDERFDYVYRFVTERPWNPTDRAANRDLLDAGTLSVAKFEADGRVRWMPLVHGQGPLTAANGFRDQGEVMIEARRAADLLGATPMDRPEDVETNPVTGRVYVMLTNNERRTAAQIDAANPRARNTQGHIVELIPPGAGTAQVDHAADEMRWGIFLVAGRPGIDQGAQYHRATSDNGWLSCPDNCAFDGRGRMWIATDGAPAAAGIADGLYATDTMGPGRALTRLFYQAPTGAEVCGPCFTPDHTTVFLAIQHPGEDPGSTFEQPSTRWPDFTDGTPPRPSVIAIVKQGGGVIG